jgi:flagellar protein FliO/FliZ
MAPPSLLTFGSLFGAAAALAAVLALIWALHALGRARLRAPTGTRLHRAETIALDPKRRLHLIRCDQSYVLIQTGGAQDMVVGWLPEGGQR